MKRYFAISDDTKHVVLGMSPKVNSPEEAARAFGQKLDQGAYTVHELGARKADAEAELSKLKAAMQATARQHEMANVKAAEAELRASLNTIISNYNEVRKEFLEEMSKTKNYALDFEWGAGNKVVRHEYQANMAAGVLNNAEKNPERHLFDWLFLRLRYELKLAVEMRHEGSQDLWRLAVRNSKAEGRRTLLEGMNGLAWAFTRGQRCIAAREELGLPPPPWTKVDVGFVKIQWDVPGFERDTK